MKAAKTITGEKLVSKKKGPHSLYHQLKTAIGIGTGTILVSEGDLRFIIIQ